MQRADSPRSMSTYTRGHGQPWERAPTYASFVAATRSSASSGTPGGSPSLVCAARPRPPPSAPATPRLISTSRGDGSSRKRRGRDGFGAGHDGNMGDKVARLDARPQLFALVQQPPHLAALRRVERAVRVEAPLGDFTQRTIRGFASECKPGRRLPRR